MPSANLPLPGLAIGPGALGLLLALASAAPAATPSPPGAAIPFDGKTAFSVPAAEVHLDPKQLTVAAWVRIDTGDAAQVFLNQGAAGGGVTFYLYNGRVRMLVRHRDDAYTHANIEAPPIGTWVHFGGSYDGETICLYRDGQCVASTSAAGAIRQAEGDLFVGCLDPGERHLHGAMADIRVWNRVLDDAEMAAVAAGKRGGALDTALLAQWVEPSGVDGVLHSTLPAALAAARVDAPSVLLNRPGEGFRGIWYYNQPSKDEYVYKYSGGLGTYCAKHIPLAWYSAESQRTFFVYGGTDEGNRTLLHMVSYFDHRTKKVARPTVLLDKRTDDAHDNPVLNLDDQGYLWIFSSSHGRGRPSYISRGREPFATAAFDLVWTGNYSYPQPCFLPGRGFVFLHTWYEGGRSLYAMTSSDGREWSERSLYARIDQGHYQVSGPWRGRVGTAFNMHPHPQGLNWRTNLYYMQSEDGGATWTTVDGRPVETPLTTPDNPALAVDFRARKLNVYMKDIAYDSRGCPIILVVTSKGYESGPGNMPRTWTTVRWTGSAWDEQGHIVSDNNYDTGSLYIETDRRWRIIGPTQTGPQPYNPGGEVAMWLSEDAGHSWTMLKQLTRNSPRNHTYVRRPVNAHPDFYAFWADGHGRQPSESRLYFCTREGEVFRLPWTTETPMVDPEPVAEGEP
ncbi:MAG: BNR-4 repeat-containing protein [Lentisphaeria bacterium]|nr:BNR-4 repeat-containing protein [Lentisphaeria bacterium]